MSIQYITSSLDSSLAHNCPLRRQTADWTSCAGGRHNMPPPRPLQADLLILKVVSESHVKWATSVLKAFCCETSKRSSKIGPFLAKNLTTHLDLQGARVYFRLFGVSKMTAKLTSLHRIWSVCTATTWCSEGDWSILHKTREDPYNVHHFGGGSFQPRQPLLRTPLRGMGGSIKLVPAHLCCCCRCRDAETLGKLRSHALPPVRHRAANLPPWTLGATQMPEVEQAKSGLCVRRRVRSATPKRQLRLD